MESNNIIDTARYSLGKRIRIKRTLEGKTQLELSAELGIPQSVLSRYELDNVNYPNKHIDILCKYVNITK